MKSQATAYLEKADEALDDARHNMGFPIPRQAARLAYYAAFHAAQASIFETHGKAAKTHKGVNAQFAKISIDENLPPGLSHFLATTYHFKTAADLLPTMKPGQLGSSLPTRLCVSKKTV